MVLTIKRRFGIYKRFEKDIWGLSFSTLNLNTRLTYFFFQLYLDRQIFRKRKIRRFIYRIDVVDPAKRKHSLKSRFVTLRLVKLFYLTLKYRQFRHLAVLAAKMDGFFQSNFCLLLEGRLASVIYRTNLLVSMFEIIDFIKRGNVLVNRRLTDLVNFNVYVGDVLTFFFDFSSKFRLSVKKRFRIKGFVFNTPRYMFINYKLFFAFIERLPFNADLGFPIKLDIYRATGYY